EEAHLHRRDRHFNQHDQTAWTLPARQAARRQGSAWSLENDDLRGWPTGGRHDRSVRRRRADEWRNLSHLSATLPGADALTGRDRQHGQSPRAQSRWRARDHRSDRSNAVAAAAVFPRPQSDRTVVRQTQSEPKKSWRAFNSGALGPHRNNSPKLHLARVQKLLHTCRIWVKLRGIRSRVQRYRPASPAPLLNPVIGRPEVVLDRQSVLA